MQLDEELRQLLQKSHKETFDDYLFYFLKEFNVYPLSEEFIVEPEYEESKFLFWKQKKIVRYRIIKKGINSSKFIKLLKLASKYKEQEVREINKQKWLKSL
jgi:hypothetical protein